MTITEVENNVKLMDVIEDVADNFLSSIGIEFDRYDFYRSPEMYHDDELNLDITSFTIRSFGHRQFLFTFHIYESTPDSSEYEVTYDICEHNVIRLGKVFVNAN